MNTYTPQEFAEMIGVSVKTLQRNDGKPTDEQKQLIHKTIGTCRFIYNFYLSHNKEIYQKERSSVSGMDFSKWLNNDFIPSNPEFSWIKEVSSKSVKQSIMDADSAFKKFFKKQTAFPKFKKKNKSDGQIES